MEAKPQPCYNRIRAINDRVIMRLQCMYARMKSTIRTELGLTDFFECLSGTRQGCMVSPFLFALYIRELIEMLDLADCKGVYVDEIAPNIMDLLYADDVALCSDSIGRMCYKMLVG